MPPLQFLASAPAACCRLPSLSPVCHRPSPSPSLSPSPYPVPRLLCLVHCLPPVPVPRHHLPPPRLLVSRPSSPPSAPGGAAARRTGRRWRLTPGHRRRRLAICGFVPGFLGMQVACTCGRAVSEATPPPFWRGELIGACRAVGSSLGACCPQSTASGRPASPPIGRARLIATERESPQVAPTF